MYYRISHVYSVCTALIETSPHFHVLPQLCACEAKTTPAEIAKSSPGIASRLRCAQPRVSSFGAQWSLVASLEIF